MLWLRILVFTTASILFVRSSDDICSASESSSASTEPCFDVSQFSYDMTKKGQQDTQIELECYVNNKGASSVVWMHDNQLIAFNGQIITPDANMQLDTDNTRKFNLKIAHLDANHRGAYRCQISTLVAKNLEYNLDILTPPTIVREPSTDVIYVNEGESVTIQCLTAGNPKPKLTWTKKGKLPAHIKIDEDKATLNLQDVDRFYSDSYSCMAINGVGNPVTSEFQIQVKYKPNITIVHEENFNNSVIYTAVGKKEKVHCQVSAYPPPKMSLIYNDLPVPETSLTIVEPKESDKQMYGLVYSFVGSSRTFGEYICTGENEMGLISQHVSVSAMASALTISHDKLPLYSDALLFEWSLLSGSAIQELHVQIVAPNQSNATNLLTKTKHESNGEVTYQNENIHYSDYYEVTKLAPNNSYVVRMRVKNEFDWSAWSSDLVVKTHVDDSERHTKHKSWQYKAHHRHHQHDPKYNLHGGNTHGGSPTNTKRDRYNSYLSSENSAPSALTSCFFSFSILLPIIVLNL